MSIFLVEGMPGAGKTTLCLKNGAKHEHLEEYNQNLFEKYLSDMKTYAYEFQTSVQEITRKRMNSAVDEIDSKDIYIDRTHEGNLIFCKLQYEKGFISDIQYAQYLNRHNQYCKEFREKCSSKGVEYKFLYIICSVDKLMKNIKKRSRKGESVYTLEYITSLKEKYDQSFIANRNQNYDFLYTAFEYM